MASAAIIMGIAVGFLDVFNGAILLCTLPNVGANYLLNLFDFCLDIVTIHGLGADVKTRGCAKHKMFMGKLAKLSSHPPSISIVEGVSIDPQWIILSNIKHQMLHQAKNPEGV